MARFKNDRFSHTPIMRSRSKCRIGVEQGRFFEAVIVATNSPSLLRPQFGDFRRSCRRGCELLRLCQKNEHSKSTGCVLTPRQSKFVISSTAGMKPIFLRHKRNSLVRIHGGMIRVCNTAGRCTAFKPNQTPSPISNPKIALSRCTLTFLFRWSSASFALCNTHRIFGLEISLAARHGFEP